MHYLINNYQIQLTTKLLINKQINIKFHKNKLYIKLNPNNIDIPKLLTKNNITYSSCLNLNINGYHQR